MLLMQLPRNFFAGFFARAVVQPVAVTHTVAGGLPGESRRGA
ncbi:hypothetical protein SAMN05216233_11373 [Desulfoluna spongiiphila]|uniref:Uncharacterized protein n=1 Tax=Desulfoluna spongiiphila TaxID=419481 RepID=A0A1G5HDQ1_9BACT|nr:hypothetical protein SAMN05216233_11373 [Desulfoluna spongiiphila]